MHADLLAETVTDDTGLRERRVLVEGARQNVIRNVVTQVTNEEPEPAYRIAP